MRAGGRSGAAPAVTLALAARAHTANGRRRDDPEAIAILERAARDLSGSRPGSLLASPSVTREGVLLAEPASSSALLDTLIALSVSLAPVRATFCAAVLPLPRSAAIERAVQGLDDADPRAPRVVALAPDRDELLGALAALVLEAYRVMTVRQRQVVSLVKEIGSQEDVARHLGVTRQAVNQCLGSAGWPHLREAERTLRRHVARSAGETPGDAGL